MFSFNIVKLELHPMGFHVCHFFVQKSAQRLTLQETLVTLKKKKKTSTIWPSQNFLLYNGTIIEIKVNEWI